MKINPKSIALFLLITVQNFVICMPSFANTCSEFYSSGLLRTGERRTKIFALKDVKSVVPEGWDIELKTQSLPIEILRSHLIYSSRGTIDIGARVWIDSDLGNANVNIYRGGRIEISLSSVMNRYTAERVVSYPEIVNRVKMSSLESSADFNALSLAGALEITSKGIVILTKDLKHSLNKSAQRLTQSIVDFLQQSHSDAPLNSQQDMYYARKHLVQKEIAKYVQNELGVMPSVERMDIYASTKDLLDPQENRPAFFSHYVVKTKEVGEVSMLLGNDDYSAVGISWIVFKPAKPGENVPSEAKIREVLGSELSDKIERIYNHEDGSLQVNFSKDRSLEVTRQMVFRLVSALKDGSLATVSSSKFEILKRWLPNLE